MIQTRFVGGSLYLPELGLWLDAHTRKAGPERVFVSHAHSDHLGAHREVLLTPPTAELMHHRLKGRREERLLEFGVPADFSGGPQGFRVTLWPAGHILGSAMIHLETGGSTLLYTGDFKLSPGQAAETCAPCPAEVLIMETTFGRPLYHFPDRAQTAAAIVDFCRRHLADGVTPVLLAYSLGKSQELLKLLAAQPEPVLLHEEIWKITRIYERHGHRFPPYGRLPDVSPDHAVVIWPPHRHRELRTRLGRPFATAVVSGWAIDPRRRHQFGAEAAFPLSDHADFPELLELVRQVSPAKIFTVHGYAADFAQTLRDLNYDAHALSEPDQLGLRLGV